MKKVLWSVFAFVLLSTGCDRLTEQKEESSEKKCTSRTVYTHSISDMEKAFDDINYSLGDWDTKRREIPRVYLTDISSRWGEQAQTLPVKMKKSIFFQMILPLVLLSNEELFQVRARIEGLSKKKTLSSEESLWLRETAIQYKLLKDDEQFDRALIDALLLRVNIIPPSLALAQAAKESGWGTSRFSLMGNSLFGQWDLSGQGMVPAQQRKELGTYGLARFKTPLLAVNSYMANLNTHSAYSEFRALRARIVAKGEPLRGTSLVMTLDRYSEQGQAYVDALRSMMSFNRLAETDMAQLSGDETIFITPVTDPEDIVSKRMQKLLSAAKVTRDSKKSPSPSERSVDQLDKNASLRSDVLTMGDDSNGSEKIAKEDVTVVVPTPLPESEKRSSVGSTSSVGIAEDNDTNGRIPWEWESNTTVTPWSLGEE